MTPRELKTYLTCLVEEGLYLSVMCWGAPGIGKSSVVAQIARARGLALVDLRLSQLAPTDLRGLPVPDAGSAPGEGIARWYPPEFLPQPGDGGDSQAPGGDGNGGGESKDENGEDGARGILFLDELNMAPPTLQGIAQQLILDRRVGSYRVPDGWLVWAAGNRKEDRASVFDMPAPLANRFIHLEAEPHLASFQQYALERGLDGQIQAFIAFRPELLFKLGSYQAPAWPSPRSWEMAARLHAAGLDVAPAVGEAAAGEFYAFARIYERLPALGRVLRGEGAGVPFPEEPSERYAVVMGLATRPERAEEVVAAFRWLLGRASGEMTQLFASSVFTRMRSKGQMGALAQLLRQEPRLQELIREMSSLFAPRPDGP